MSKSSRRTLTEDVLVGGLDDWAYASWVQMSAVTAGVEGQDCLRAATLGLIAELLFQGLMVPGDIVANEHSPWNCSPAEALERIVTEWLSEWADEVPTPGAIVWLANTAKGDEIARAVLVREGRRAH